MSNPYQLFIFALMNICNLSKKKFNKKSYENVESSSDESYGDFDVKDPFKDDEIEAFNNESDKVFN